jgi:hypothetical protein
MPNSALILAEPSLPHPETPPSDKKSAKTEAALTGPPSSLIYGAGISERRNYLTTKQIAFSDLRYCRLSHFHFHARPALPPFHFHFANSRKINRKPELLEPPVSYRKQRTGPPINRKLFQPPCFPFSLFTFPFSLRPFTRLVDLISHSPLVTNHCISNRIPEILEPHLTPALSIKHPVLIANFEPTVCVSPRLPEPSRGAQPETSVARQFTCQRDCCRV